jgi:peptidoglycan/xylan/chitin deacetylase (PgdA/CDA1 family)
MCSVAGRARKFALPVALLIATSVAILSPATPHRRVAAATAPNPSWTAGVDGRVLTLRDGFDGSVGSELFNGPLISRSGTPTGKGYSLAALDGGMFTFGDAHTAVRVAAKHRLEHRGLEMLWPAKGEVALTFDDGPGPDTPAMLAMLEFLHVPATFFVVGYEVAENPSMVRQELRDGYSVENHTWDHPFLTRLSPDAIARELQRTTDAIESAAGVVPQCFRPPFGATDAPVVAAAAKLHLRQILWNSVPNDYELPGSGVIAARVLAVAHGQGLLVGMHDGGGPRKQTIAALPAIVTGLRARGYRFVRLC